MSITNTISFMFALMRNEQEKYAAWAVGQVGQIDEQIEGCYSVECTLPDGRTGRTVVEAPSKHSARDMARERVMYARLAQDYDVDTTAWVERQISFRVIEEDLRAVGG
jgi:hypothetical protein